MVTLVTTRAKKLPTVSISTSPLFGAVQEYQSGAFGAKPAMLGGLSVGTTPKLLLVTVPDVTPGRTCAVAKLVCALPVMASETITVTNAIILTDGMRHQETTIDRLRAQKFFI